MDWIQSDRREIVNSEPALLNDPFDFRQPHFTAIIIFQRAARDEAQIMHCEDNRLE